MSSSGGQVRVTGLDSELTRGIERLSRAMRKSHVELGWLWPAPTWPWPTFVPRARPFDYEID